MQLRACDSRLILTRQVYFNIITMQTESFPSITPIRAIKLRLPSQTLTGRGRESCSSVRFCADYYSAPALFAEVDLRHGKSVHA